MQASPINAAQLMMEFMDGAQTEIGHGIIASEFSKELENQQQQLGGEAPKTPLSSTHTSTAGENPRRTASSTPPATTGRRTTEDNPDQRAKSLRRLLPSAKPAKNSQSQLQEEILITNPGLLEKILADLKVPAEARKACKSSEDSQGQLSLKALVTILDQLSSNKSTILSGQASGQDVEALLKSLAMPQTKDSMIAGGLVTKPRGTYTLQELGQILEKAVQEVQKATLEKPVTHSESGGQTSSLSAMKGSVEGKTSASGAPKESPPLMTSSIPSFLEEDAREIGASGWSQPVSPSPEARRVESKQVHATSRTSMDAIHRTGLQSLDGDSPLRVGQSSGEGAPQNGPAVAGEIFADENLPDGVKRLLNASENRQEVAPLRDTLDMLKETWVDTKRISFGQSLPEELQSLVRSILPDAPGEMVNGKPWAARSEVSQAMARLQELSGNPFNIESAGSHPDQPQIPGLTALDTTMSSMNNPQGNPWTTSQAAPPRMLTSVPASADEIRSQDTVVQFNASMTRTAGGTSTDGEKNSSEVFLAEHPARLDQAVTRDGERAKLADAEGRVFKGYSNFVQSAPMIRDPALPLRGESLSFLDSSWPHRIVQQIQELIREKSTAHLTLDLEPKELGRMTLRVETRRDEVTAYITTEKDQAKEILLRNALVLRQHLEEQGLTLGQFLVDVRDENSNRGYHSGKEATRGTKAGMKGVDNRRPNHQPDPGVTLIRKPENQLISLFA